jgi:hypothetical protein
VLDHRFGLADGFDVYNDEIKRDPERALRVEAERRGEEVVNAALKWLPTAKRPFFPLGTPLRSARTLRSATRMAREGRRRRV